MMDARRLQGAAGEIKSLQSICGDHRDITAREPHHYSFVQSRPPSVPVQQRSVILAPIAPALSPACSALGSTRDSALDGHATPLWIHPSPSHCPRHTCSATAASIQPSTAIQTLASTRRPHIALDTHVAPLRLPFNLRQPYRRWPPPITPQPSTPLQRHSASHRSSPLTHPHSELIAHADAGFQPSTRRPSSAMQTLRSTAASQPSTPT